jgi:LmbE family N-acetylglucosaminyl deacetylase
MTPTVLHFAPHPDDELLGAPATLMALRDAGYRIVNLACSLGRRGTRERRRAELREACRLAGFELIIARPPIAMSSTDDAEVAHGELTKLAERWLDSLAPEIVVSPGPHDRHRGHELVGRAVRDAMQRRPRAATRWWMWGLWGPLELPTLGTVFDRSRMEEILTALGAYRGELRRNDYRRLIRGRSEMNASLGPELLAGFGETAPSRISYVELLTEVAIDGGWLLGQSRWLDPDRPLVAPTKLNVRRWIFSKSITERYRYPRASSGREGGLHE